MRASLHTNRVRLNVALDPTYDTALKRIARSHDARTLTACLHEAVQIYAAQHGINLESAKVTVRDQLYAKD